jgi:hypothetical protein
MYKRCKVVILHANQKAGVIWLTNNNQLIHTHVSGGYKDEYIPIHLYILSDEDIVEGDWCINSYDNQVWQYMKVPCPMPYWGNKSTLRKIIATTDTSLFINKHIGYTYTNGKNEAFAHTNLPQPSSAFITKFIKQYNKGNIITHIMVKYDEQLVNNE